MATSTFAIQAVREIGNLSGVPIVQAIFGTASLIFESVKTSSRTHKACLRVTQLVNETMEIVHLEFSSASSNVLPVEAMSSLQRLNRALENVLDYIRDQSRSGLMRLLVSNTSERQAREELSRAVIAFQSECLIHLHVKANEQHERRTETQAESLHLLRSVSRGTAGDNSSQRLCQNVAAGVCHERSLVSSRILPSTNGVLIGRIREQRIILDQIAASSGLSPARVAILGDRKMGKTTLALSILSHISIVEQFSQHRYFISCDRAVSIEGLIAGIADHFGIFGSHLRKRVLGTLMTTKLLLVLDNFETPWEAVSQRLETERFLAEITALDNVTLIITMRGSERPWGTSWTTPVLEPLKDLDTNAS